MALNLQSLSITSAFNSIVNFFRSQENNSKWRDLTTGSEGSFLIRLLANVMSTLSYRIVAQSRENYLSTASLTSSNVGIAVNLGYSVFRGTNMKRLVYLTPNGNYTLPKFSVIGSYDNTHSILTLNEENLIAGQTAAIETVVGNLKETSFITGTSDTKVFTLFTTGISEDFMVFKDSQEIPSSRVTSTIKEMVDDKILIRTNPYSSVDMMYLNTFEKADFRYGTGTEFTIRYVELDNVEVKPYENSMFTYGTLQDVANISSFIPFESAESIKVNAPLDHETQNLIRSKADYANRIQQIVASVIDSDYKALTPTYTLITYLKEDSTLLTGTKTYVGTGAENKARIANTEVGQVLGLLKEENFFGTPLPDITVPRREVANLQITLALSNKYKNIADINLDIQNILQNYYNIALGITFNTFDLERKLEALSYVRYARVDFNVIERETSTNYQLGSLMKKDGNYYKVSKILGYSGASEPNWSNVPEGDPGSEIDTGAVIQDGSVYWRCFKKLPNMSNLIYSKRTSMTPYGLGDYVYVDMFPNYMFKCVDLVRQSGSSRPSTTYSELGDFIVDGGVVWVVKTRINEAPEWQSLTQYQLGDTVNVTGDFSLECVSYTGSSGTDENLEFELPEYPIIKELTTADTFTIEGQRAFYFKAGDVISAAYEGGYDKYYVVSSQENALSKKTIITVTRFQEEGPAIDPEKRNQYYSLTTVQRGTRDGFILWSLVSDINNVKYDWNSYVTFTHTLTILED